MTEDTLVHGLWRVPCGTGDVIVLTIAHSPTAPVLVAVSTRLPGVGPGPFAEFDIFNASEGMSPATAVNYTDGLVATIVATLTNAGFKLGPVERILLRNVGDLLSLQRPWWNAGVFAPIGPPAKPTTDTWPAPMAKA